jgi:hypothetical protein
MPILTAIKNLLWKDGNLFIGARGKDTSRRKVLNAKERARRNRKNKIAQASRRKNRR